LHTIICYSLEIVGIGVSFDIQWLLKLFQCHIVFFHLAEAVSELTIHFWDALIPGYNVFIYFDSLLIQFAVYQTACFSNLLSLLYPIGISALAFLFFDIGLCFIAWALYIVWDHISRLCSCIDIDSEIVSSLLFIHWIGQIMMFSHLGCHFRDLLIYFDFFLSVSQIALIFNLLNRI